MMEQETLRSLLIKAGSYAAKYEKTVQEVRAKLEEWSEGELLTEETEWIIEQLCKDKFIDEERYVERYIRDKVYSLKKGPMMIRQELNERGVPSYLIEGGLEQIPYDDWFTSLKDYLSSRLERHKAKAKNGYDLRRRLQGAAFRRGYPSDVYTEVIDELKLDLEGE